MATAIRDRIHPGGQLTKEERGALARDWFAAQTATIEAIDALAAEMAAHENHSASTQLIRAAEARHQIWEMAEFLGRERGMVNGLLAAKAIPDQKQLMRLAEYRGHVNSAWTAVRPTIEQLGNGVAPLLASATAALTGPLEELRQSVDDAYLAGTAPTASPQDCFGQTTRVIEQLAALQKGVGAEVVAQEVKQLAAQTEKATTEMSLQATEIQAATKSSSEAIESIATRVRDIGTNAAGEVGASISGVADAARETSHTSSEVHDSASSLSGLVAQLKQEVSSVLVGLRNGGTGRG